MTPQPQRQVRQLLLHPKPKVVGIDPDSREHVLTRQRQVVLADVENPRWKDVRQPSKLRAGDNPGLHPGRPPGGKQDRRQLTNPLCGGILDDHRQVDVALRSSVSTASDAAVEDQPTRFSPAAALSSSRTWPSAVATATGMGSA